jgi:hypothetical protein
MYNATVLRLKNVRVHPNADKVKLATCHGNQVVVGLDNTEDELGVYFPSDGQLSHEFCHANNLYRDSEQNKDPKEKPGMFDLNRRVRAQKFRGEISDGFWVPLSNFDFLGFAPKEEGLEFDTLNNVQICSKYVNPATIKIARENQGKKTKSAKKSIMFKEHFDTAHFGKNSHEFEKGQRIIISEKVHGTSHRIGHVLLEKDLNWKHRLAKRLGIKVEEKEWVMLNGTRRVVIHENKSKDAKAFHDPTIRDKAAKLFKDNLRKGETVFLEIVGYESTGATIMPSVDTTKMGDKVFTGKYGKTMTYSYGCDEKNCEIYVYRMTLTNEDGQSVDYSWDDVVKRCNEIGVKHVPHIRTLTFDEIRADLLNQDIDNTGVDDRDIREHFEKLVETAASGPSLLDDKHIKEGVCVRIEGGLNNKTFKFKSFEFRVLEGIVKDSGVVDTEEAQDNV